jgi:hypothetical protein
MFVSIILKKKGQAYFKNILRRVQGRAISKTELELFIIIIINKILIDVKTDLI